MTTGQNIADEVRLELNDGDASNLRWSDTELLGYINAAQREIVTQVPQANIVEAIMACSLNDVRQTIPSGGIKFLGAWNYDVSLLRRGPAMTPIELDALNSSFPEWSYAGHQTSYLLGYPTTAGVHTDVQFDHFAHDPRDPKAFYVFPPPVAVGTDLADGDLWETASTATTPPTSFEELASDGRYWFSDAHADLDLTIEFIGSSLPLVLTFSWEIVAPPDSGYINGGAAQVTELGSTIGLGAIEVDIDPNSTFQWGIESAGTGAQGYLLNGGTVAVGAAPLIYVKYSAVPTALATLAGTFALGDEWRNAATQYTIWRAISKDGRYQASPAQRQEQYNVFLRSIGKKPQADQSVDPGAGRAGGDANG